MQQFDDNFLQSVGLGGMPDDQKQAFLDHLYSELELRVGTRLSEGMSNEQLEEFEKLIDAGNQQGALTWLETNRPNYKQVVAEELEKLKQEVAANKDVILGDMAQMQQAGPAQPEQLAQPGGDQGGYMPPQQAFQDGTQQTQPQQFPPQQPPQAPADDPTQLNIR